LGLLTIADYGKEFPDNERYAIVDGGRRWRGLGKVSSVDFVPCQVYDVDSWKEAALMFYLLDTRKIKMSSLERFRAAIPAGEPTSVQLLELFRQFNIQPKKGKALLHCETISKCEYQLKKDPIAFKAALRSLEKMCKTDGFYVSANLIRGVPYLYRNVIDAYTQKFQKRLENAGAKNLNDAGKKMTAVGLAGDKFVATAMLELINKNLKEADRFKFKGSSE
jgi:hypothetical protein